MEEYDREFKFEQKRIILRHNLHNKIAKELRNRKLHYQEEFESKLNSVD